MAAENWKCRRGARKVAVAVVSAPLRLAVRSGQVGVGSVAVVRSAAHSADAHVRAASAPPRPSISQVVKGLTRAEHHTYGADDGTKGFLLELVNPI